MASRGSSRLLTRAELRAYCGGLTWAEIVTRMERGQLPGPLWGVPAGDAAARWDQRAIDRALDLASDVPASLEQQTAELDRAFGLA